MKINLDYDGYDIKSLNAICEGVEELRRSRARLQEFETDIRAQIDRAHQDFETVNYDRTYETLNAFRAKLFAFDQEMKELSQSVREFAEDIDRRWK